MKVETRKDYITQALVRIANNSTKILTELKAMRESLQRIASE